MSTARIALFAFLLLTLAACSVGQGQQGGTPERTSPPTSSDRSGAPIIRSPRDLASRVANPCGTLLTSAQVRRLGYGVPGESRVTAAGSPTCTWRARNTSRRVDASLALKGDLFVATYRNPDLPLFRPLAIAGLPAVDTRSRPDALTCTTTVGVADSESLDVTGFVGSRLGGTSSTNAPCEDAHRVAEEIISTLPPK